MNDSLIEDIAITELEQRVEFACCGGDGGGTGGGGGGDPTDCNVFDPCQQP